LPPDTCMVREKAMPKVAVATGELYYEEAGKGIPLILLHSGGGSTASWKPNMSAFAEKYRVIAYDRPGYGQSSPREVFPLDYFDRDVEDLAALLEKLGLTERVFLCGCSDGGTIALLFAARFPERTRAIVCEGAHGYVEEKAVKALREERLRWEEGFRNKGLWDTPRARAQAAFFDRWLDPAFRDWNVMDRLARIGCPTLIVQGTEDEYAEMSHAERLADAIKGSVLWEVDGAGHMPHASLPDEFNRRTLAFLADK